MAQYYYDKFNVNYTTTYNEPPSWSNESGSYDAAFAGLAKSYSWNSSTGKFVLSSNVYSSSEIVSDNAYAYKMFGTELYRYRWYSGDLPASATGGNYAAKKNETNATSNISQSKGSLVQSNIPAEDGTYPANGRHSDGYWYVKGAAVGPLPPGQVINQPYKTDGNGGRKLVRMPNGNLYVATRNGNNGFLIFKSINNGVTWTMFLNVPMTGIIDIAIVASPNNTLCVAYSYGNAHVTYQQFKDDGTLMTTSTIDGGQSVVFNVSLAIDTSTGHLHAAWASKNTQYPNSYNIRYTKSSTFGSVWSTVEKITNFNVTGTNNTNPSIVVRKDGVPVIIHSADTNPNGSITCRWLEGGTWKSSQVYFGGPYAQTQPSAVVDKNGVIHVTWHGMDSTDTSRANIRYSKSLDGGVTWSAPIKLTTGNSYSMYNPSITVDKNNVIFLTLHGSSGGYNDNVWLIKNTNGIWGSPTMLTDGTNANGKYYREQSTLHDNTFSVTFGDIPPMVYQAQSSVEYIGSYTTNTDPTLTLNTADNQTLYENDTLNISGEAYDSDKDQTVTVFYQINNEPRKVLATNLSQTQISLTKQLKFNGGKLYDGDAAITGSLVDGVSHKLKVWAVDSENGQSAIVEKSFYVVPNRAPLLTVDAIIPSGVVDTDKFKISGTSSDQDANSSVKVTRCINNGNVVEIYNGPGGEWEFEIALAQLQIGENVIVVEVIDNYGAKTSKTIKLNKNEVKTPILQSVARYKIEPPKGNAKGVLLFIERDKELDLKVELSMTLASEQEQYETLSPEDTAPMPYDDNIVEDTFYYETTEPKDNIVLKLTMSRTDLSLNYKIHLVSGAVE